jgi:hypothetical protein
MPSWSVFARAVALPSVVGSVRRNSAPDQFAATDFDRIADDTSAEQQLYERMLAIDPARVNPGALWSSAPLASASRQGNWPGLADGAARVGAL